MYCSVLGNCYPCGECFFYDDAVGGECPEHCLEATTCFVTSQCPRGYYCNAMNTCAFCGSDCWNGDPSIEQLRCEVICAQPPPDNGYYLCDSHDDCSADTYCDANNNCYTCDECFNYNDPYDGTGRCPEKCRTDGLQCEADYHCRPTQFCTRTNACHDCSTCDDSMLTQQHKQQQQQQQHEHLLKHKHKYKQQLKHKFVYIIQQYHVQQHQHQ
ncbi:hypothetical protein PTSG_02115 [Salpingoeca rosetta]|uniref:Uncharacterized protein n=1 Tax=Salpingoeca rosetta (strain ATCC 50818 / BSB-021) TaxID=946362 RepID=F2U193_SALR5|nr:uncharacterized protein PTSG_02115 [Salpingoeca rosetta]EGD81395.1 hypothetical protein PTSG_02115 [Salpingoeca rosetta]|eukprot:XP_004996599.1 hypothetical protein PTSG_02115 [Salpingoeca rosetta]